MFGLRQVGWVPSGSSGHKIILTLPDLPDHTVKQCHGFLRELIYVFDEHFRARLARAYGWAPDLNQDDPDEFDDEDPI